MTNKKVYIILISAFLFLSCGHTSNPSEDNVILTDHVSKEISLNELFDDFEYISLETSEEGIFGTIDKLIIYDNRYYILDLQRKKVFVFREDGTFMHTIGNPGKGPGEYTHIEDFTIDEENKKVIILGFPSLVYVYDTDGKFIMQKNILPSPVWRICNYKDGFICSNDHQSIGEPLIYIFDKEFNMKGTVGKTLSNNGLPTFITCPFLKDGENIAYFDNFNLTICFINTANPSDSRSTSFILPRPNLSDALSDVQKFFTNQGEYSFFLDVSLCDNILWATYVNQGKQFALVRDFKSKKQITAKYNGWFPTIMCYTKGCFYAGVSVGWILDENPPIASAKQVTKYLIDEDSNPVIVRFKPKQVFK